MHRPEREGGAAHPVGQGGAVEGDALASVNLRLAIERYVVGIFGDQHMCDQRLGRDAVLDQPLGRRGLRHFASTGTAGVFGAAGHDHLQPRWDHIEAFGDVLADAVLEAVGRVTGDTKNQVEGVINQAAGAAQDLYGQAKETASDAAQVVRRGAMDAEDYIRHTIEKRPYTTAFVALCAGWLIGRMGRRDW